MHSHGHETAADVSSSDLASYDRSVSSFTTRTITYIVRAESTTEPKPAQPSSTSETASEPPSTVAVAASSTSETASPSETSTRARGSRAPSAQTITAIVAVVAFFTIACLLLLWRRARKIKAKRQTPNSTSKSGWRNVLGSLLPTRRGKYQSARSDDATDQGTTSRSSAPRLSRAENQLHSSSNNNNANASSVDRNTSVRSTITLPSYRQTASQGEQILGREGERDGIDVIIDLPTAEEEEASREDEMNTLFQIRELRRQQQADREARRIAQREARARNDVAALQELRNQARAANSDQEVLELRDDLNRIKENRNRSTSSVSYHDLGVARHDGSRIRANSTESERTSLLSDAASMAASTRERSGLGLHQRGRSSVSMVSLDSDMPSIELARSRMDSHSDLTRIESRGTRRAGSSPELVDAPQDGQGTAPPPGYEDISLDDDESGDTLRRANTPNEPPPEYPGGPTKADSQDREENYPLRETNEETESTTRPVWSSESGLPRLPSIRLNLLPSIVVEEPPSDHDTEEDGRAYRHS